jgi:hypothetical protein
VMPARCTWPIARELCHVFPSATARCGRTLVRVAVDKTM